MALPRSTLIDTSLTSYYHIMSRCVRRSYLYGKDKFTGKDYSHRKGWIVDRIKYLSQFFTIDICAYAVMSNHYHLVLHVNLPKVNMLKPDELMQRWRGVFPRDAKRLQALINISSQSVSEEIFESLRERLSDISWYMRCLNETIAKQANKEDEVTGRFWEGRFQSQALLDEGAILSAMAYVDLNPIRAKIAKTPESSDFTSIQERIRFYQQQKRFQKGKITPNDLPQPEDLMPFAQSANKESLIHEYIDYKLEDYLELVDETGRVLREDKKGAIPKNLEPILERLNLSRAGWLKMVKNLENEFCYAVGHVVHLKEIVPKYRNPNATCVNFVNECYLDLAS